MQAGSSDRWTATAVQFVPSCACRLLSFDLDNQIPSSNLHRFDSCQPGPYARFKCAVERRRHPVGASPTRQLSLQPEAIEAVGDSHIESTTGSSPSMQKDPLGGFSEYAGRNVQ